jgi:beta-glucanase (GH16 family)
MNHPHTLHFALLGSALVAGCVSAQPAAPTTPPSPEYRLVFEDNFDGDKVDESFWDYRVGKRGGEDETAGWINALNRKENVTLSGGMMRIRHAQEQINGKTENTCGGLISKRRFGYGYFETRYKPLMITSTGTHAAFWMRGIARTDQPGEDPTRPAFNVVFEIDSSEVSSPHWIGTNNLYPQLQTKESGPIPWVHRCFIPITPDADGFIVDAFEYRPDGVIFYDNGKEVARTDWNMLHANQEIWLTSLAGAGWRQMDAKQLPCEALFDYFRFYSRDWPGANLLGNPGFEYNTDHRDPQIPLCWLETGDVAASFVATGNAFKHNAFLRHSATTPYKIETSQTLQHILDGPYIASAMVRSSGGQRVARLRLSSPGASDLSADIPATEQWTRVEIGPFDVKGNTATLAITSDADPGQWIEVDDVVFMKPPLPGQKPVEPRPFRIPEDPPYQILTGELRSFADGRGYLFDRTLGIGSAFSVCFTMKPSKVALQTPIERFPADNATGWSVQLTPEGDVTLLIGNAKKSAAVVAPKAYRPGEISRVVCTFDRGAATLYIDGKPLASRADLPKVIDDKTAPGTIGIYWTRNDRASSYDGQLGDVRVYNRALTPEEVAQQNRN